MAAAVHLFFFFNGIKYVFRSGNENTMIGFGNNNSCTRVGLHLDDREPPDDGSNTKIGFGNNNSCKGVGLHLDDREPPDDGSGPFWQLKFPPRAILVRPNVPFKLGKIVDGLPDVVFPLLPSRQTIPLALPSAFSIDSVTATGFPIKRSSRKTV